MESIQNSITTNELKDLFALELTGCSNEKYILESFMGQKFNPFVRALENIAELTSEQLAKSVQIYASMLNETRELNFLTNISNNQLLAQTAIQAAVFNEIKLWRFVCMPKVVLTENGWQVSLGDKRYDTLNPALTRDQEMLNIFRNLDLNANITYVLDDWEIPFVREKETFLSLPVEKRNQLLDELIYTTIQTKRWILQNCNLNPNITFFSEIINAPDFFAMQDQMTLELDPKYIGVLRSETDFLQRANKDKEYNSEKIEREARRRITQYAVEGSILREYFSGNSLYLNAEYPISDVWQKLTLITPWPTLFYVRDKEIKNI